MRRKTNKMIKQRNPDEEGTIQKTMDREYEGNFYRTYSFLDLLNLVHIQNLLKRDEKFYIGDKTMLSVYEGHTIFSIFQFNPQVYEQIHKQIRSRTFEESIDAFKNPTENVFLRRLFRILNIPTKTTKLIFDDERCTEDLMNWCRYCGGK